MPAPQQSLDTLEGAAPIIDALITYTLAFGVKTIRIRQAFNTIEMMAAASDVMDRVDFGDVTDALYDYDEGFIFHALHDAVSNSLGVAHAEVQDAGWSAPIYERLVRRLDALVEREAPSPVSHLEKVA